MFQMLVLTCSSISACKAVRLKEVPYLILFCSIGMTIQYIALGWRIQLQSTKFVVLYDKLIVENVRRLRAISPGCESPVAQ